MDWIGAAFMPVERCVLQGLHPQRRRIEPRNNLAYAARAIWCVKEATGVDLEPGFQAALRAVRSWRTGKTGEELYAEMLSAAR